jgi:uncharacterized protein (UPF0335 family)
MSIGHNSAAGERLRSFVERIERLQEEKKQLQSDIAEIFSEAKSAGYDVKAMRQVIRERAMDAAERQEREALVEVYRAALGMLGGTPLGEAALSKVA